MCEGREYYLGSLETLQGKIQWGSVPSMLSYLQLHYICAHSDNIPGLASELFVLNLTVDPYLVAPAMVGQNLPGLQTGLPAKLPF
jgi:hypothetical protein